MRANVFALVLAMVACASVAGALEVSTKNNIGGHMEYAGFTIVPVHDVAAPSRAGDLASPRMFEIIRPGNQSFTIGRLYTSCTCMQIVTDKKHYGPGERAFVTLRNVRHNDGQLLPFYVQITTPLRVILRHDAWMQSDAAGGVTVAVAEPVAAEPAAVAAVAAAVVEPVAAETAAAAPVVVSAPTASGYQPVPLGEDVTKALAGEPYAVPASPAQDYVAPQAEYVLSDKDLF